MTQEELAAAIIGGLVIVGGIFIMIGNILKKLGWVGKDDTPIVCPVPDCQDDLKHDLQGIREEVIVLQQGQVYVREQLEHKRLKIEVLVKDSTEIKTDVKWIVRELQKRNDVR